MPFNAKVAKGLAKKLGIKVTPKDSAKRVARKVVTTVDVQGAPKDITADEQIVLKAMRSDLGLPEKADTTPAPAKETEASAPVAAKPEKTKPAPKPVTEKVKRGSDYFREVMASGKKIPRENVENLLRDKGLSNSTIQCYISGSQADPTDKKKNPTGIMILKSEEKGVQYLQMLK